MVKKVLLSSLLLVSMSVMAVNDPVKQALSQKKPVVVMFTKSSCPFCVWIKPLFNQLRSKAGNKVQFLMVDVSSNPTYFKNTYGFRTVPTLVYFDKNGRQVVRHGSNNKGIRLAQMDNYLQSIC